MRFGQTCISPNVTDSDGHIHLRYDKDLASSRVQLSSVLLYRLAKLITRSCGAVQLGGINLALEGHDFECLI